MSVALIMAGGTGGHIFPALSVAESLRAAGFDIVWLGTKGSMEEKLVPQRGFEIELLKFSGVRKSGLIRWIFMPFLLFLACLKSLSVIFERRPDVVLGMGGFASFPGGLMAAFLGKPLVIHEQNSIAGLTNKVLSIFASRVLVAFPGALKNGLWVGNPVRPEISCLPEPERRMKDRSGPLSILVLGGSRGASALNETVPKAVSLLSEKPFVVHQSGEKDVEKVKSSYAGMNAEVLPFIADMAKAYEKCDLVISRSGALTIAEIAAAGLPSILVPYPHAVDDHQTHNARFLSEKNAAFLIPQQEINPEKLASILAGLSREKLLDMAKKARVLAVSDATEKVAQICRESAHAS